MWRLARDRTALYAALSLALIGGVARSQEVPDELARLVTFETADGGRIGAHLYGAGSHAVVLAHGKVFDKESWHSQAVRLSAAGFRVLAIDFRGYGRSEAGSQPKGLHLDVLAAIRYLQSLDVARISVVGASMGGGAAGRAATQIEPGEIDRLILLAPAPIEQPENLRANKIVVIAARQEPGLRGIEQLYDRAPEPKHLELIDGSAHAQHIFKTEQSNKLMDLILVALGQ